MCMMRCLFPQKMTLQKYSLSSFSHQAKTTKDTSQTVIDDLIPGSRYKFRIKAENDYGISEPGKESNPFDVAGGATATAAIDRYCDSLRHMTKCCSLLPERKDLLMEGETSEPSCTPSPPPPPLPPSSLDTASCATELLELPSAVNNNTSLETATCG